MQKTNTKSLVPILLAALSITWLCPASPSAAPQDDKPRVRGVRVQKILLLPGDPSKASLVIDIDGEKFGKPPAKAAVTLTNQETAESLTAQKIVSHNDAKIVASVDVPVATKATTYVMQLSLDGVNVIPPEQLADYTIEVKKEEKSNKAKPLDITFETFKSPQYPNLYSLLITNKADQNDPKFSSNPALMKVDILPPGATNVNIQAGNGPHQMVVTFLAPEDFDVKNVVVTVFDPSSTLGNSEPVAFSTPFEKKQPKADPNQHKITNVEILSLQRRTGMGRVLIQGTGFGDYTRPPVNGDRELLCCLDRPMTAGERNSNRTKKLDGSVLQESGPNAEVCNALAPGTCQAMRDWRRRIEQRVNVTLVPRNPDLRIERTQIVNIDDKSIDVYFEFTHFPGYSQPFRLASATVTINKGGVRVAQAQAADDATITASVAGPQTYSETADIGVPRDKNLEYRYTVLDQKDASLLFGSGVGDKFFVIELAVLNKGEKKVAVPLSAIQAEIEWAYGDDPANEDFFFEEGPATIPPLALADVTAYFDSYQKTRGRRARIFNTLDGVATLAASLVPVFGHNIERPTTILTGGFTPALKTVLGDLSSRQLQNLTSRTWENVEEVPAKSGKTKFIFVQRGDQLYDGSVPPKVKKQIKNIRGLEVIGYEITDSKEKAATQQQ
ncbi:MAG: hypothetical protein JOZ02_14570 [Acidobacteria bacterium]|nr:hypothetical protein [Acidobacteriota bacterium]